MSLLYWIYFQAYLLHHFLSGYRIVEIFHIPQLL